MLGGSYDDRFGLFYIQKNGITFEKIKNGYIVMSEIAEKADPQQECPICLNSLTESPVIHWKESDNCAKHPIHAKCANQWIQTKVVEANAAAVPCPSCREIRLVSSFPGVEARRQFRIIRLREVKALFQKADKKRMLSVALAAAGIYSGFAIFIETYLRLVLAAIKLVGRIQPSLITPDSIRRNTIHCSVARKVLLVAGAVTGLVALLAITINATLINLRRHRVEKIEYFSEAPWWKL